ncbi:MAG: DUF6804 family protein [Candidatus Melainabacteria bacterium]|nr:DUF6804 family protein [Candidatus Melainabacteria bacterium]
MVFTVAQLAAIALLIWAIGDHPYDYYKFMRFVVCAVSVFAAYRAHEVDRKVWVWFYLTIAVLFNPFATVHLDRERWAPIDLIAAVVLLIGMVTARKPKSSSDQPKTDTLSATPLTEQVELDQPFDQSQSP